MFRRNSDITVTRPKPDHTSDKQSTKIHLLSSISCKGDNTQAATNGKIQIANNKSEYKSVWL